MKPSRPILHAVRIADAVLFWPALMLVTYGELSSQPERLLLTLFGVVNDKMVHFAAYFALGAMAAAGSRSRPLVVWAVLGLILLGGAEIIQSYVGRDMSLLDELANSVGAIAGTIMARSLVEPLRRRVSVQ